MCLFIFCCFKILKAKKKAEREKFCLVQKIGIMVIDLIFALLCLLRMAEGVGLISVLCKIPHKRPRVGLLGERFSWEGGGRKEGKA